MMEKRKLQHPKMLLTINCFVLTPPEKQSCKIQVVLLP